MASNMSTRCLVFPCLICFRVLYLSRPWDTFCWWMTSFCVTLDCTLAFNRSALNVWWCKQQTKVRRLATIPRQHQHDNTHKRFDAILAFFCTGQPMYLRQPFASLVRSPTLTISVCASSCHSSHGRLLPALPGYSNTHQTSSVFTLPRARYSFHCYS